MAISLLIGSLLALGALIAAFACLRRKRLIDDLPTSKTQGVFIGVAELKGTAESEMPLTSYLAGVSCVEYKWSVEEHWSRTVHETYRDAQGHTHTRTRHESGWTMVARDSQSTPFYLKDETGIIRIQPEGATIHDNKVFDETCSRAQAPYFTKGPAWEIANSDHKRRFRESAIPLHTILYVIGKARERQDIVAAEIAHDKESPVFLISTRSEKQISTGYAWWFWLWMVLGLAVAIGGVAAQGLFQPVSYSPPLQSYIIAALGFLFAGFMGWVWTVYNSLIGLRNRVRQAWSQIDVQLKRRSDLIPRLVTVIQGYSAHESELQEMIAGLRTQALAALQSYEAHPLKGVAPAVSVLVERYPELKASELFLKLQRELSDTEQRIALARGYFNEIATFYNIRLDIIPDRFVAGLIRLRPYELLGVEDFERAPINVRLVT